MRRFVLVVTTTGDDLISPKQEIVAESAYYDRLKELRGYRLKARKDWLSVNKIPWWAEESIIASEEIQEVFSL